MSLMLIPLFWLAFVVFLVASIWKVFVKAGHPGWAAIIPIYNLYIMLQIAGRPAWWLILFLIPVVSLVVAVIVFIDLAKAFGRGTGFAIGLLLLGIVFWPILGFGSSTYQGKPPAA